MEQELGGKLRKRWERRYLELGASTGLLTVFSDSPRAGRRMGWHPHHVQSFKNNTMHTRTALDIQSNRCVKALCLWM